jgi:hypothetical protein
MQSQAKKRTPIPLKCNNCGHEWETRAQPGRSIGCPKCKKSKWIPTLKQLSINPAGWETVESIPEPQLTGEVCEICDGKYFWTPAYAGWECENGHWILPTESRKRIDKQEKRQLSRQATVTEQTPLEKAEFDSARNILSNKCLETAGEYDTKALTGIPHDWNDTRAAYFFEIFRSLAMQAQNAKTADELQMILITCQETYKKPEAEQLRYTIQKAIANDKRRHEYLAELEGPASESSYRPHNTNHGIWGLIFR